MLFSGSRIGVTTSESQMAQWLVRRWDTLHGRGSITYVGLRTASRANL